jgi:hypothetical protein
MSLFDLVFGCTHKHCSFPITVRGKLRRSEAASVTGTYVVCLDCGKEFPYDWKEMKIVKPHGSDAPRPVTAVPNRRAA